MTFIRKHWKVVAAVGIAVLLALIAAHILHMAAFAYSVPDTPANNLIGHDDAWFTNGLGSNWQNPDNAWTWSVSGNKNPCPLCINGTAAKLGPDQFTGNAVPGQLSDFYIRVPSDGPHTAVNFQMHLIIRSYTPTPNEMTATISGSHDGINWTPIWSQFYSGLVGGNGVGYADLQYPNIPSPNYAFYEVRFSGVYYEGRGSLGMKVTGIAITTNAASSPTPTPTAVPPTPTAVPTSTPTAVPPTSTPEPTATPPAPDLVIVLDPGQLLAVRCANGQPPTVISTAVEVACP